MPRSAGPSRLAAFVVVFWISSSGVLAGLSLWPVPRRVAPEWAIRVTQSDGAPAVGVVVREISEDYSVEVDETLVAKRTDGTGLVVFEPRVLRTSRLRLFLHGTSNLLHEGLGASFGPRCYATISGGRSLELPPAEDGGTARSEVHLERAYSPAGGW